MGKPVTIKEVAALAGVTKATVSRALRDHTDISSETRQRVFRAAKELQYQPAANRQTRGERYTGQIVLLMISDVELIMGDRLGGSYVMEMVEGCAAGCKDAGRSMVFCKMTYDDVRHRRWPVGIARDHLDGLIVRAWMSPEVQEAVAELDIPYVLMECDRLVPDSSQVQIENISAMELLVDHLVAQGAKQFATITAFMEHISCQERLVGLQMALMRRGIKLPEENICIEKDFLEPNGQRGARTLLERRCTFDALVCQNDLLALGAMDTLAKSRIRVPDDVMVTGFDNMSFSSRLAVPLTTVDSQSFMVGQAAVKLLMSKLAGTEVQRNMHVAVTLQLVARQSTRVEAAAMLNDEASAITLSGVEHTPARN